MDIDIPYFVLISLGKENGVTLQPHGVIKVPEGASSLTFSCLFPGAIYFGFMVSQNGTRLDKSNYSARNITEGTILIPDCGWSYTLTIGSSRENNEIQICCFGISINETVHYSENATFVILGTLIILQSASLNKSSIRLCTFNTCNFIKLCRPTRCY